MITPTEPKVSAMTCYNRILLDDCKLESSTRCSQGKLLSYYDYDRDYAHGRAKNAYGPMKSEYGRGNARHSVRVLNANDYAYVHVSAHANGNHASEKSVRGRDHENVRDVDVRWQTYQPD